MLSTKNVDQEIVHEVQEFRSTAEQAILWTCQHRPCRSAKRKLADAAASRIAAKNLPLPFFVNPIHVWKKIDAREQIHVPS